MNASVSAAGTARQKFLVVPIVILILAQMGTTGDNGRPLACRLGTHP